MASHNPTSCLDTYNEELLQGGTTLKTYNEDIINEVCQANCLREKRIGSYDSDVT